MPSILLAHDYVLGVAWLFIALVQLLFLILVLVGNWDQLRHDKAPRPLSLLDELALRHKDNPHA